MDERRAKAILDQIGFNGVKENFLALSESADRRFNDCVDRDPLSVPFGYTAFDLMTPEEREQRHILLLALQMGDPDTPEAAHGRIVARINKRRLKNLS